MDEIYKNFSNLLSEVLLPYENKELSDDIIKELYYTILTKLKKAGWNISEQTWAEPSSLIIITPPNQHLGMLIAIPPIFDTISKKYKQQQIEDSYRYFDMAFGC